MVETETITGLWHMPGKGEHPFNGTLTFGPEQSIRLTLMGNATKNLSDFPFDLQDYTIWGYDNEGKPVSLFDCNRLTMGSRPIESVDFNAAFIILGAHLQSPDDAVISGVRFSFAGMEEWMGIFGQEIKFDDSDINVYQLAVHRPKDIPFVINEEISGAWSFWTSRPYYNSREIKLQQDNLFKLIFNPPRSLTAVLNEVWSVQSLYTLFTFEQTWVRWIYLNVGDKELRLFYRQRSANRKEPERLLPLLRFPYVIGQFEQAISRWTSLRPSLRQIMAILQANIGDSDQYAHNNFLNIVQAVEAYHRRSLQNTAELKAANESRVERILASIQDEEDKTWLAGRLIFSYEPNLATRLKELFSMHEMTLFENPPSKGEIKKLIRSIVDKRNYFTHYDPSLETKEDDTLKLINLTRFLTMLLAYCLLGEIGFDSNFLQGKLYRRYRFNLSNK